jgi:hypothetical protein
VSKGGAVNDDQIGVLFDDLISLFHVAPNVSLWSATGKLPRASLMSSALVPLFCLVRGS